MAVKKGDSVKVHYTGTLTDGSVFDSSEGREPLEFKAGEGSVIKGFDDALIGMEVGQEKTVNIPVEMAYGQPNPEMVRAVPKGASFPSQATVGSRIAVGIGGQQIPAIITKIEGETVTLDFNHPLAGKDLIFKIKLVA